MHLQYNLKDTDWKKDTKQEKSFQGVLRWKRPVFRSNLTLVPRRKYRLKQNNHTQKIALNCYQSNALEWQFHHPFHVRRFSRAPYKSVLCKFNFVNIVVEIGVVASSFCFLHGMAWHGVCLKIFILAPRTSTQKKNRKTDNAKCS